MIEQRGVTPAGRISWEGVRRQMDERARLDARRIGEDGLGLARVVESDWWHVDVADADGAIEVSLLDVGDGRIEICVGHGRRGTRPDLVTYALGRGWRDGGRLIDARRWVEAMIDAWPAIAAPFLSDGSWWQGETTLAIDGGPIVSFGVDDAGPTVSCEDRVLRPGDDGMFMVAALRTATDRVAELVDARHPCVAAWTAASAATALPRLPFDRVPGRPETHERHREASHAIDAWFATRAGATMDDWCRTAVDVDLRTHASLMGRGEMPDRADYSPTWTTSATDEDIEASLALRSPTTPDAEDRRELIEMVAARMDGGLDVAWLEAIPVAERHVAEVGEDVARRWTILDAALTWRRGCALAFLREEHVRSGASREVARA